jgi:hypothetical protein
MPKAKSPRENIPRTPPKVFEGNDAIIKINLFAPDNTPVDYVVTIPNIRGSAVHNQRTPEKIIGNLISGLRRKYGDKVK